MYRENVNTRLAPSPEGLRDSAASLRRAARKLEEEAKKIEELRILEEGFQSKQYPTLESPGPSVWSSSKSAQHSYIDKPLPSSNHVYPNQSPSFATPNSTYDRKYGPRTESRISQTQQTQPTEIEEKSFRLLVKRHNDIEQTNQVERYNERSYDDVLTEELKSLHLALNRGEPPVMNDYSPVRSESRFRKEVVEETHKRETKQRSPTENWQRLPLSQDKSPKVDEYSLQALELERQKTMEELQALRVEAQSLQQLEAHEREMRELEGDLSRLRKNIDIMRKQMGSINPQKVVKRGPSPIVSNRNMEGEEVTIIVRGKLLNVETEQDGDDSPQLRLTLSPRGSSRGYRTSSPSMVRSTFRVTS